MIAKALLFALITFGITMAIGLLVATIIQIIATAIRRGDKKIVTEKPKPS